MAKKSKKFGPDTSWHERFLQLLGSTCNVTLAARGAGVSRATAYGHKNTMPEFSELWENAEQEAVELLEAEAWKRARAKSDLLIMFLLKAHRREKYQDRYEVTGKDGAPVMPAVLTIVIDDGNSTGTTE